MGVYLLRRLTLTVITVVTVSFVAFVCFAKSLDPSGPMALNPDQRPRHAVQAYYHLTDPVFERYWLWMKSFFHHGFGSPASTQVDGDFHVIPAGPLWPDLSHAAWVTAQLVGFALVIVVVVSVLLGILSAQNRRSPVDFAVRMLTYLSWAVPTFLIAFFMKKWIVPDQVIGVGISQRGSTEAQLNGAEGAWFLLGAPQGGFVDWFRHMTLPAVALALGLIGVYARYIRSSMIGSLQQPYAVVARGKGLTERRVVAHHALRNSLIPFVSALSLEVGAVVGASLAADFVFQMGGLASYTIGSLGRSDPFEMTAVVIILAVIVIAFMTIADLVVGWLDPRVRVATSYSG
jgi:ABC-type dipeptide/oligopeptide/nickel transport system permease component